MKINFLKSITLVAISIILFSSCDDDENTPVIKPGQDGFFILNEGAFGGGDASLSYFDKESKTVTQDLFYTFNNEKPLGDQAQSMTIIDSVGYIVVQNSAKIEVVDIFDYTNSATIGSEDGIESPRFFLGINESKGYVSDWGTNGVTGTIKVIDLATNTVLKTIPDVGQGTNKMILVGSKVYAANAGGWGADNTITIIDTETDTKIGSITVSDNPSSLVADAKGNIWVAGKGKSVYSWEPPYDLIEAESTEGFLAKINSDDQVEFTISMPEKVSLPSHLELNSAETLLYFNYSDGVYTYDLTTEEATSITRLIEKDIYGFSIDPSTDNILIFEAPSFSANGSFSRYLHDGTLIDSFETGIGPNSASFY